MSIMNYPRLDEIIDYLITHNSQPTSLKKLSDFFSVSQRTIRSDVQLINDELTSFNSKISLSRGKGYQFKTDDNFLNWWKREKNKISNETNLETPKERQDYLLLLFFTSKDYLELEHIINSLFISKNTFYNYLKNIKPLIEDYNLKLLNRPNLGFILIGNEFNKRQAIMDLLIKKSLEKYITNFSDIEFLLFKDIDLDKLQYIEIDTLKSLNLFESDYYHKNLLSILALSICRIKQEFHLESLPIKSPIPKQETRLVFDELIRKIQKEFNIVYSDIEVEYLYYHLLTNFPRLSLIDNKENSETVELSHDLITDFLQEIKINTTFDWTQDKTLRDDLVSHVNNFLSLELYTTNRQNPLLDTIKRAFPLAYDISLIHLGKLEKKYGVYFSEDEIGYITLHLAGAIERNKVLENSKLNVVIICGSGLTMSKIIELKIKNKYSEQINVIGTYSFIEFKNTDCDLNIDLIISTVPIIYKGIPIHMIDMNNLDYNLDSLNSTLSNFTNKYNSTKELISPYFFNKIEVVKTKNLVLDSMIDQLIRNDIVSNDFKDSVWLRESIGSTYIGNGVAIPHPMDLSAKKSILSISIAPDGVQWNDKEKVNFVFLFAISKKDYEKTQQIYNYLLNFIDNNEGQQEILKNPDFLKFLKIFYENDNFS